MSRPLALLLLAALLLGRPERWAVACVVPVVVWVMAKGGKRWA